MILKKKFLALVLAGLSGYSHAQNALQQRPLDWAQKIELCGLHNFYKVDENIYRSEQPTKMVMHELSPYGIKTVLNVRNFKNDNKEAKGTNLILERVSINTWTISYAEVVRVLKIIDKSPKPILIHCKHGSDRTGCIIAAYRIVFDNWTKEQAIKEFREGGFGYNERAFPNILKLLNAIDVEKLKKDVYPVN